MDREEIISQFFSDLDEKKDKNKLPIFYDELDEAIIGVTERMNAIPLVTYSYTKMVEVFVGQGMSYEEAVEWVEFNVIGGWLGDNTPMFIRDDL